MDSGHASQTLRYHTGYKCKKFSFTKHDRVCYSTWEVSVPKSGPDCGHSGQLSRNGLWSWLTKSTISSSSQAPVPLMVTLNL